MQQALDSPSPMVVVPAGNYVIGTTLLMDSPTASTGEPIGLTANAPASTRGAAPAAPKLPEGGRVLHFPRDRALGTVRIIDANFTRHLDTYYYWLDDAEWVDWSVARGDVAIPPGKRVWLEINPKVAGDLAVMNRLGSADIFRASLSE